ncbi:uncharacterized protein TRUGW13939_01239 [Talaromyces rugulosus]|uniref:Uncharacterized protein n=1 Tax=Talaromyces rugulosus TaxID=121627 RepID=A0A7H8QKY4_TALRU|nr:uncharacterized protein TRUGW13939_01239 [Talaromyces rugulosus]QKX54155.1 hypothetical protein TRUGW13939_01239 [Talaromyces rugulosus]
MAATMRKDFLISSPMYSRRYSGRYEELDHLSSASLCYREIGKVKVDCRFRLSKSQWGVLGEDKNPAGILYMDLGFDQPQDFRLKSATVLVTLQYGGRTVNRNNNLHITDYYGPKNLRGIPTSIDTKQTYRITPNVAVLGNGIGGLGVNKEKYFSHSEFWSFTGQLLPGKSNYRTEVAYRTVKWELTENELDQQPLHSNVIHTAFTFQHENDPDISHQCRN